MAASVVANGGSDAGEGGGPRSAAHPAYRAEIDGLRALAVLPVVLSHADVRGFGGGFVGVDIFFVISGYLITGILIRDLQRGRHSLAEFYRRRILRIFPALFAMLAVTTAIAAVVMLPIELVRYAKSLGAAALFSSNVLFFFESGYFDTASTTKPLLHTWSLAVEEQFYIFWPLLLAAVCASRLRRTQAVVLGVSLLSFVLAAVLVWSWPSFTFYLIPTRTWELGLGALLAIRGVRYRRGWIAEVSTAFGLALILLCIWAYSERTPFPGPAALLPCLGACLLILPGSADTIVGRALSLRPAVFVGRISYSLYLWHWPVIVFAETALLKADDDPLIKAVEIAVSLVLAIVSWRFIEQPFRSNVGHWRTPRVLTAGAVAIALSVAVAGALLALKGLPWRYSPQEQAIGAYLDLDVEQAYRRGTCFRVGQREEVAPDCFVPRTGKPVVLLLGDSHAAHLWPGFASIPADFEVLQVTMAGCRPLVHSSPSNLCRRLFNRMLLEWAPRHRPAAVLLAGNWRGTDLELLQTTLANPVVRASNPVVVGPVPQYDVALPRTLAIAANRGDRELIATSRREQPFVIDDRLRALTGRLGIRYISPIDALCRGHACRTMAAAGIPMQFDYGHLTVEGSQVLVRKVVPQVDAAIAGRAGKWRNDEERAGGR